MKNESDLITYDQETELAETFRPNSLNGLAVHKVRSFLNNPLVKQTADEDLRLALISNKIDVNYVIKERKQVVIKAKKNKQYNAVNVALDRLDNHLGLNDKVTISETRTSNSSNLQDNFQKAQNDKVKVTVSTEINANNEDNNQDKKVDNEENTRENTPEDGKTE